MNEETEKKFLIPSFSNNNFFLWFRFAQDKLKSLPMPVWNNKKLGQNGLKLGNLTYNTLCLWQVEAELKSNREQTDNQQDEMQKEYKEK